MLKFKTGRRNLLKLFTALTGSWLFGEKILAATQTPRSAEGPFYPTRSMRFEDVDNDLVKILGSVEEAGGQVVTLRGQVLDQDGQLLSGLRVEIWQCDVNGKYLHTGDRSSLPYDTGFQGFGHDITDIEGRYSFRTIKPTVYPGRTPHIHVKVLAGEQEVLVTQFYLADHPGNVRDGIFLSMSEADQARVSMVFFDGSQGSETTVDIIV